MLSFNYMVIWTRAPGFVVNSIGAWLPKMALTSAKASDLAGSGVATQQAQGGPERFYRVL